MLHVCNRNWFQNIFTGAVLTIVTFLILITSALKLDRKLELLIHFTVHQAFIEHFFKLHKDFPTLKTFRSKITLQFLGFFVVMVLGYFGSIYLTATCCPDMFLFSLQYQVMTMIVHAQSFQILVISRMIEQQLKSFNSIDTGKFNENGQKCFKKTIVKIFEHVEQCNGIFSSSMLLTLFWVYTSLLSNLHWIGISFLGDQNANFFGNF